MDSIWNILSANFDKYRQNGNKSKGYTKVPNTFIEDPIFTSYEKMIAIVICKHQMNRQEAWPSHQMLARQAGCSISTVKKSIRRLQIKGILYKARLKGRTTNTYRVKLLK